MDSSEPKVVTVAMPRAMAQRLKVIAVHTGETMPAVQERLFAAVIDREYDRVVRRANAELGGEGG